MKRRRVGGQGLAPGGVLAVVANGVGGCGEIVQWFEEKIGMESRASVLGHIQRGGSSTVFDRRMAFLFTIAAIEGRCSSEP